MPAVVASFVVPALADDEVIIVRVPAAQRRDPGFPQRLGAFLAQDAAPSAGLWRRDELIREIADRFYTGSRRPKAVAMLADVNNYVATDWQRHKESNCCPAEIDGSLQGDLWRALKAHGSFPTSWRQIWNILLPDDDRERFRENMRQNNRRQLERNPERHRVRSRMSSRMWYTLKRYAKTGRARASWLSLVDYTLPQLIARLKRTLPEDYTWQDFLDGKLHIDHIVSVSAFHFRTVHCQDFKRCWALKNLRLLPGSENCAKGAKLLAPFQPSLL